MIKLLIKYNLNKLLNNLYLVINKSSLTIFFSWITIYNIVPMILFILYYYFKICYYFNDL